jgi:hypothetical protein
MSTEGVWGAPTEPTRWGMRETAAAIGVAAVIAGLGGAAIFAATDTGASRGKPGSHQGFGPPPGGGPGGPGGGPGAAGGPPWAGAGGGAAPLHGEFVVRDGGGGYATRLTQTGTITATTATTLTVRSADDYSQTWEIPVGASAAPVGAQVSVEGTRDGTNASASRITPNR